MRDDSTTSLFAAIYGLALGMTLGAVLWTTPMPAWRDAALASCRMGQIESGLDPETACPSNPRFAADEAISVASVAALAPALSLPRPSPGPRR